jgi:hypothetical protein
MTKNLTATARFKDRAKVDALLAARPDAKVRELGLQCFAVHSCCCSCDDNWCRDSWVPAWEVTGLYNREIANILHAAGFVPRDTHLVEELA